MKNRRFMIMFFNSVMIITAIALAVMFGILGYDRPHGPQDVSLYDFDIIYSGGRAWLNGLNAYDDAFAYPPNSSLLFMLFSLTDLHTSKILFIVLNILCIISFVYISLRLYNMYNVRAYKQFFIYDFKSSLLISMIVGNVFVANILWVGQTSIIFSVALLASFYYYIRSYEIRSGIFLAFALNKPQLAYTFLLWLFLEKKWKTLAAVIISTVVMGLVPIYNRGIITTIHDWLNALNKYIQIVNREGLWQLFGLQPLLLDYGININSIIIFAGGVILVTLVHHFHKYVHRLILLGILIVTGLLLGQAGQYDLIIIFCILPYYLIKIHVKEYNKIILLCLAFIFINFPRKLLFLSDYRILHHHREIMLIMVLLSLLIWREEQSISGSPNDT